MNWKRDGVGVALVAVLAATSSWTDAQAQGLQAPATRAVDESGVDLLRGPVFSITDVVIGDPADGGLAFTRTLTSVAAPLNGLQSYWDVSPGSEHIYPYGFTGLSVSIAGQGDLFEASADPGGGVFGNYVAWPSLTGSVATADINLLSGTLSTAPWQIRHKDGLLYTFQNEMLRQIERPNGEKIDYHYTQHVSPEGYPYEVLRSVTTTSGYMLHFEYGAVGAGLSVASFQQRLDLTKVIGINTNVYACPVLAETCSDSQGGEWPSVTFSRQDSGNELWATYRDGRVSKFRRESLPGGAQGPVTLSAALSAVGPFTVERTFSSSVTQVSSSVTRVNVTHTLRGTTKEYHFDHLYGGGYSDSRPIGGFATGANGFASSWSTSDYCSSTDAIPSSADCQIPLLTTLVVNGRTTTYDYGCANTECLHGTRIPLRLKRVTEPEGNWSQIEYDYRGNVTRVERAPRPGTGSSVSQYALFVDPSTAFCGNWRTCNQPVWIRDEAGAQTDFFYGAAHGGLTRKLLPASGQGPYATVRGETNFVYSNVAGSGVWKPTSETSCAVAAICANSKDELVVERAYNNPNLRLTSTTHRAGDNSVSSTVAMTYTPQGDVASIDGPLAGAQDTSFRFYDTMRRLRATVAPDPDGGGPLNHVVTRTTLNADSNPTLVELGTAATPSGWSSMTVFQSADTGYDGYGRKTITQTRPAGGMPQTLTEYSYNGLGLVDCIAVRMDPSTYTSLPSSACTPVTTGSFGPDRITRNTYDASGRLTKIQRAYGTSLQQDYATYAYTPNDKQDWVEDANGNRTDYTYDGFDRLAQINFPSTTVGAHAASGTDYEQYGYDVTGNRTSVRLRSGETATFQYDTLSHQTFRDYPATNLDVATGYDLLGRRLWARFGGSTGPGITYAIDALGRVTGETRVLANGPASVLGFAYDAASNRVRMTWPDGNYVTYNYDAASRVTSILENGALSGAGVLAIYTYDPLGRRQTVSRAGGGGGVTSYSYDGLSRLSGFGHDLSGTTADMSAALGYNPASQLSSRALTDNLQWGSAGNFTRTYTRNGLNQYASVGGVNFTYDARGNLTSDGVRTFTYDLENHLTYVPGGLQLQYDPLGRLARTVTLNGTETNFIYDGDRLVAEYRDNGTLLRRYAHGPGVDEPLVWYEGAGLSDRRWMHTDAQGSVVATSLSLGQLSASHTYGPYGEPGSNDWSGARFRYTGQIALPEVQLYHYKARVYDPVLGRFLQTDPVGYDDGLNWYTYVGNDPLNATDPSGELQFRRDSDRAEEMEQRPRTRSDTRAPSRSEKLAGVLEGAATGREVQTVVTSAGMAAAGASVSDIRGAAKGLGAAGLALTAGTEAARVNDDLSNGMTARQAAGGVIGREASTGAAAAGTGFIGAEIGMMLGGPPGAALGAVVGGATGSITMNASGASEAAGDYLSEGPGPSVAPAVNCRTTLGGC